MRKHLAIILVLVASIAVHFAFFGYPKETVFDEVHFGKFVSGYFTHEYFFDIHPPLGKLIISGAAKVTGFQPGFSFANIGEKFPDNSYLWLRLLPTLAGTLLPAVIFLLALELGFSKVGATGAGLLVVFESALLIQSRFMLLDAFLLLFGFAAWWLYGRYRNTDAFGYLIAAAILGGLAVSVKWTGATFLGIIGVLELIQFIRMPSMRRLGNLVLLVVIPAVLYFSIFAIHFALLNKTGPGDAFMTPQFRKTLIGSADSNNPDLIPKSLFGKFIELNQQMYESNARLTATHPYSSKWYTWPFMLRPIYYWNDLGAKIYLMGNPVVWWASTFGIFYVLITVIASIPRSSKLLLLMSGAYLVNMLPFIGIDRAMFLYHYFIGLIIAILALAYLIDQLKSRTKVFAGLIGLAIIAFVFFAPLVYGKPTLTQQQYNQRVWLKSWE